MLLAGVRVHEQTLVTPVKAIRLGVILSPIECNMSDLIVPQLCERLVGHGDDVISCKDWLLLTEASVDRRFPASHVGLVDDVVVREAGRVIHLADDGNLRQ